MSDNFLGELKLVSFDFAPKFWAQCNGQILPIAQNQALFSLFGTLYGGNGQTTFGLPNLQGRAAIHGGNQFRQGETGGEATHTLQVAEMPAHTHLVSATTATQNIPTPLNNFFANQAPFYGTASPGGILPADVTTAGGGQAHENRQPYLVMNWIVALAGIFPSQS